jgi:(2Fe-2S) ferredoxin
MRPARFSPTAQIFVCGNQRAADDPLTSTCGAHGAAVYDALRKVVRERGLLASVWVTRTGCLGQCPKDGCALVIYPAGGQLLDVREADASAVVELAVRANLRNPSR